MAKKKDKKVSATPQAPAVASATLADGVPTLKDLMAPASFDRSHDDHIKVGNKYCRNFVVSGYPKMISVGWADSLYNYEGDLDCALHIVPMDERQSLDELTHKITQFQAQLDTEIEKGSNRNVTRLQTQIQELIDERHRIEQNYITMFRTQMAVNLYSDSLDKLNKDSQMLEHSMRGRKIQLMPTYLQMDKGYQSGLPYGQSWLPKMFRNFSSDGLTACFPFYSAEICHPGGTYVGVNLQTATPIYLDFFNRKLIMNGNMTVFGMPGSGKSFFTSLLTMRSALNKVRTVLIDPEGEYGHLAVSLGGANVVIDPDSYLIMNPFDLEVSEEEDGSRVLDIRNKVADMMNLIGVMAGGMSHEAESLVSFVLSDLYADFGFTTDPESLYKDTAELIGDMFEHRVRKVMPTMSDFYERLKVAAERPDAATLKPLVNTLRMFTKDGVYGMFDRQTAPELDRLAEAPVVCFDVSGLEENILRPIGMYIALNWAWEKFGKRNPQVKKRIVVDEAWMLMNPNMAGHEYTEQALETIARRSRKRSCSLCITSQSFREMNESPRGEAILSCAPINFFFRQKESDLDGVQAKFKLSDGETSFLGRADKGQFLLRINQESTVGQAIPFSFEKQLVESGKAHERNNG